MLYYTMLCLWVCCLLICDRKARFYKNDCFYGDNSLGKTVQSPRPRGQIQSSSTPVLMKISNRIRDCGGLLMAAHAGPRLRCSN